MLALAWNAIDADLDPPPEPESCGPGSIAEFGRVALTHSDERDVTWLSICSAEGIESELVAETADVTWFDYDGDGVSDIALRFADGSTRLFNVLINLPGAVVDIDALERLTIADLRCGDTNGNGQNEMIDAVDGAAIDLANPLVASRGIVVTNPQAFLHCY